MSNGEYKEKMRLFRRQVIQLGGDKPLAEWTDLSGMVGYEYDGNLYRWRVPTGSNRDGAHLMGRACLLAIATLTGLRDGIEFIGGKTWS